MEGMLDKVAEETGRTPAEVHAIMMHMFGFIRDKIDNLDFSKVQTEDDLRKMKTNFNIPRICKLYTTISRVEYVKNKVGEIYPPHGKGANVNNNIKGREEKGEWLDSSGRPGTE